MRIPLKNNGKNSLFDFKKTKAAVHERKRGPIG
jgi:hypothetical protein